MPRTTLLLGGARSGKSARALCLAEAAGPKRLFLATAQAFDDEMATRIARHRAERGTGWHTVEAPRDMPEVFAAASGVVVVDCLTLWLSNLMLDHADVDAATSAFLDVLRCAAGPVFLVSNEVGLGLVPETPLGRAFRDAQGRLNQAVAAEVDCVEFLAAGLPLRLKG